MATYKVIQDIEAEDKLLGPLTLKQFIYAAVTVVCLYICFLAISKHAVFLLAIFLPIALVFGFFAWPWGRDQPTEVWALAKVRFLFKPRRRIWDQSGIKELVTITVPKKIETHYTNGLTQTEVNSRLRALADTIDSRGWAVKNVNVNLFGQPAAILEEPSSDRLIDVANLPQEVPNIDVQASDDILDEHSNPIAQHFDQMITASSQAHRQQIVDQLHNAAEGTVTANPGAATPPNNYWFLHEPSSQAQAAAAGATDYVTFNSQVVAPGATDDDLPVVPANPTPAEEAFAERLRAEQQKPTISSYSHLRTLQPLSAQKATKNPTPTAPVATPQPMTQPRDAAILDLANNNDLNVATIARQANQTHNNEPPQDEVVISLH